MLTLLSELLVKDSEGISHHGSNILHIKALIFICFYSGALPFPWEGCSTRSRKGSIMYLHQPWPWCLATSVLPGPSSSLLSFTNSWIGQWSCGVFHS